MTNCTCSVRLAPASDFPARRPPKTGALKLQYFNQMGALPEDRLDARRHERAAMSEKADIPGRPGVVLLTKPDQDSFGSYRFAIVYIASFTSRRGLLILEAMDEQGSRRRTGFT